MPRILVTCPSSQLPVSTGHRAPALQLDTLVGDRAFRCGCGAVHVWGAHNAWVEDPQSLDQEIAFEMAHLGHFIVVDEVGDEKQVATIDALAAQGRRAREDRIRRESLPPPW